MARQVCVVLRAVEREQLATIAADGNGPRKHIERAHIVLASADQHAARQVPQSIGVSRPTVWRWQQRVAESGIDVLLRDKTRKPGKAPSAAETAARVVARACAEPPHVATQWTGRATAKAIGILLGSVQRIWEAHKLQPHRLRTFKRSRDPGFADKLNDVVGLYVDPPARAGVLPIDEKSQIQAARPHPALGCRSSSGHFGGAIGNRRCNRQASTEREPVSVSRRHLLNSELRDSPQLSRKQIEGSHRLAISPSEGG